MTNELNAFIYSIFTVFKMYLEVPALKELAINQGARE